ncbi:MAG: hypothetical protein ACMUEL_01750 [Flavobacteriales bacterium Tduv]
MCFFCFRLENKNPNIYTALFRFRNEIVAKKVYGLLVRKINKEQES